MKKSSIEELREQAEILRFMGTLALAGVSRADTLRLTKGEFPRWKNQFSHLHDALRSKKCGPSGARERRQKFLKVFRTMFPRFVVKAVELTWGMDHRFPVTLLRSSAILYRIIAFGKSRDEGLRHAFFHILGFLFEVACPILPALRIAGDVSLPRSVTGKLITKVMEGGALSDALRQFPGYFSRNVCSIIVAGERSGCVPVICRMIVDEEWLVMSPSCYRNREIPIVDINTLALDRSMALMFTHWAILVNAGCSLRQAVEIMREMASTDEDRVMFLSMGRMMDNGASFAKACAVPESYFPSYIIRILRSGEERDEVEDTLAYIVAYLKWKTYGIEPVIPYPKSVFRF
jgi:type II secretory pathway component PulF